MALSWVDKKLSKEIRSQINLVDTETSCLIESLDDNHPFEDRLVKILNALADVQNEITELQEQQGWI